MKRWLKQLFCCHDWKETSKMRFVSLLPLFGPAEEVGYMRWWQCSKCKKTRRTQDW